jgi:hypothetical protein
MRTFIEWFEHYSTRLKPIEINPNFSELAQRIEFISPSTLRVTYNSGVVQVFDKVKYQTVLNYTGSKSLDVLIRRLQARDSYLLGRDEPVLDS